MTPAILYAASALLGEAASALKRAARSNLPHVREQAAMSARVKVREAFAILGGVL